MFKSFFIFKESQLFLIVFFILIVTKYSRQECLCNVRYVGEYCGTALDEKNENNSTDCGHHMYFCGKTNLGKTAVLLKQCSQPGYECDAKLKRGNHCYRNIKCQCKQDMRRRGKYCGSDMTGADCSKDVVYKCPMFRSYNPTPEDGCPNGCKDGKCVE